MRKWKPREWRVGLFVATCFQAMSSVPSTVIAFAPLWHMQHPYVAKKCIPRSATMVGPIASTAEDILSPPEPLRSLGVGETIRAFRPSRTHEGRLDFEIERLAKNPPIFYLQNVLTSEECEILMQSASSMQPAETVTDGDTISRPNCQVAWLSNSLTQQLAMSIGNLFLSPQIKSHPQTLVEDLQVLQYAPGGEFVLHHDGVLRVLTVLYYLNGVGDTWFPLADMDPALRRPCNKQQAMDLCQTDPSQLGLVIGGTKNEDFRIRKGDAIAFYNYNTDGSDTINWNAIHAGLPVQGSEPKWVANHWFRWESPLSQPP